MKIFKLLMPAEEVPEGATVTKRAGTKLYELRRKLTIYGPAGGQAREITADEGCVFLIANAGTINAISGDTEVIFHAEKQHIHILMNEEEEDTR